MSSVEITIKVPEELLARAQVAGIEIERYTEEFLALLEREIRRREAGQRLQETAEQLRALPPEMKPSLQDIDEAVRSARAEIAAERKIPRKS